MLKLKGIGAVLIFCISYYLLALICFEPVVARNITIIILIFCSLYQVRLHEPIYKYWSTFPKYLLIGITVISAVTQVNDVLQGAQKIFGFLLAFLFFYGFYAVNFKQEPEENA